MTTSLLFKISAIGAAALVLGLAGCGKQGDKNMDATHTEQANPKEETMPGMSAGEGTPHEGMPGIAAPSGATHSATGRIESIDQSSGSVRIAHEAVPSAKWPAMTMTFQVADQSELAKLKVGEQVDFTFSEKSQDQYVITKIELRK